MLIKLKLNISSNVTALNLEDEIHWIRQQFGKQDQISQLASYCLVSTIYHILEERNERIFEKKESSKLEKAKLIEQESLILRRNQN